MSELRREADFVLLVAVLVGLLIGTVAGMLIMALFQVNHNDDD